jgi:class 3 adenylate cyclase
MDQFVAHCSGPAGEEIAYATVGSGPALVLAAWWTSHLELDWQNREFREFVLALAENHTVIRYDRPGVGMSGRGDRAYDLDTETGHLEAVVSASGFDSVDLLGISCGGPPCVQLAADRPDLVRRMVFVGSYLDGHMISDEATQRVVCDLVTANWGLGSKTLTAVFLPDCDAVTARRFASDQRHTATAQVAADLLQLTFDMDVTQVAPDVSQPALVLHRAGDHVVTAASGRRLAEQLGNAEFRLLEGRAHLPWAERAPDLVELIESFLLDGAAAHAPTRSLATVAFVDIVESSRLMTQLGDDLWRQRLDAFHDRLAVEAAATGGTVVKDTGDGALLTFALPGDAITFASSIRGAARQLGFGLRSGIHTGEVELRGADISGRTVVVASRLCDRAPADGVFVSATTAELAAGRGFRMIDAGSHQLKGIADPVSVLEIEPLGDHSTAKPPTLGPEFRRSGTSWDIRFGGRSVTVRNTKGLNDLATLVGSAGVDIDVVELMDGAAGPKRSTGDDVLDERAIAAYRDRLGEIEVALDAADAQGDAAASGRLDDERAAIIDQLRAASGLGNRTRRLGDDVERARKAVSARIRDAIEGIAAADAALGAHLQQTVTTGRYCRYR